MIYQRRSFSPPFSRFALACLLVAWGLSPGLAQLGEIVPAVPFLEQTDQTYALYRPSDYTRKKRWPAVILLDDSGQGQTAVAAFREAAETYGFILASPNNFLLTQEFEIHSNPVIRVYEDIIRRFATDIEGIYLAGMGKASGLMVDLGKRLQTHAGLLLSAPSAGALEKLQGNEAALVVTTGTFDANFVRIHHRAAQAKVTHPQRLLVFEGGKQWPDALTAAEALGWLRMQDPRQQKNPSERQNTWLQQRLAYARYMETSDALGAALDSWQAIAADFPALESQAASKDAIARLEKSQQRQRQTKQRNEAHAKELQTLSLFDAEIKPELHDSDRALAQNLAWWSEQHRTLTYLIQKAADDEQKNTAIRLLEYMWQVSYLDGLTHLESSRFAPASYHLRLACELFPDKPFAHYALACAYAGLSHPQKALAALEKSVAEGLVDASLVQLQPLFDPLRSDPAFQALLEKIQGSKPN